MTFELSSPVAKNLQHMAGILKIKEDALLERAVKYYVFVLGKEMNIKEEFNDWDAMSDESLDNFEKMLT
ncbi:hypothetical protein K9M41_02585 [Candidatus Gracilibacteria bacterium]|nr:hypothetical protein [Candidatus Gracilibacteria bacterium]